MLVRPNEVQFTVDALSCQVLIRWVIFKANNITTLNQKDTGDVSTVSIQALNAPISHHHIVRRRLLLHVFPILNSYKAPTR